MKNFMPKDTMEKQNKYVLSKELNIACTICSDLLPASNASLIANIWFWILKQIFISANISVGWCMA